MKLTGKILFVLLVLACNISTYAQPQIKFESVVYDYGTIREEDGKQLTVFTFSNIGNEPLTLTSVRAPCGCTVPNHTTESVAPGAKGIVEVKYNPANRPGQFSTNVLVASNDPSQSTVILTIRGNVIPRPRTKADYYPSKIGNLRFKTNHLPFQEITHNQIKTDTLGFYNDSKNDINIKGIKNLPDFLTVQIIPQTVKPEQEGIIIINYNAEKRNDFGFVFDKLNLETDDTELPEKLLYISANITYDFSNMTEKQKLRAPKIIFDTETYNFGTIKAGEILDFEFIFRNVGKDPLKILKTKPSCGCTTSEPELTTLKKNQSSKIKAKFDSRGRSGHQHHNITLHTNDPKNPVVVLYLQGQVVKE